MLGPGRQVESPKGESPAARSARDAPGADGYYFKDLQRQQENGHGRPQDRARHRLVKEMAEHADVFVENMARARSNAWVSAGRCYALNLRLIYAQVRASARAARTSTTWPST
jgi:crotonobetainyl-CoA:carnitine CoA-transferase CaiB-like acyl-CoA transferase